VEDLEDFNHLQKSPATVPKAALQLLDASLLF
jgi:hypothetical protein